MNKKLKIIGKIAVTLLCPPIGAVLLCTSEVTSDAYKELYENSESLKNMAIKVSDIKTAVIENQREVINHFEKPVTLFKNKKTEEIIEVEIGDYKKFNECMKNADLKLIFKE